MFSPEVIAAAIAEQKKNSNGNVLPIALQPNDGSSAASPAGLASYVAEQRDTLLKLAHEHGAILFRGFGLKSVEEFASVFESF